MTSLRDIGRLYFTASLRPHFNNNDDDGNNNNKLIIILLISNIHTKV